MWDVRIQSFAGLPPNATHTLARGCDEAHTWNKAAQRKYWLPVYQRFTGAAHPYCQSRQPYHLRRRSEWCHAVRMRRDASHEPWPTLATRSCTRPMKSWRLHRGQKGEPWQTWIQFSQHSLHTLWQHVRVSASRWPDSSKGSKHTGHSSCEFEARNSRF